MPKNKKKTYDKTVNVKGYFLDEASFVDEGANGQVFNFFKRLDKGGAEDMDEDVKKVEKDIVPPNAKTHEEASVPTQKAVDEWKAKNEALQKELDNTEEETPPVADSGGSDFAMAQAGTLLETEEVVPVMEEVSTVAQEIATLKKENLRLELEALKAENEMLKQRLPQVRGFNQNSTPRPQGPEVKAEDKPKPPVKPGELSANGLFSITDELSNDFAKAGIISG